METGKINIVAGGFALVLASIGGLCLGFSLDPYFEKGFLAVPLARYLLKAGHTHGMPLGLYNLIVGMLIGRLNLGDSGKKWCSHLSIAALIMPIGLILRGATEGAMTFAPVVLFGAVCFFVSVLLLIKGGLNKTG